MPNTVVVRSCSSVMESSVPASASCASTYWMLWSFSSPSGMASMSSMFWS